MYNNSSQKICSNTHLSLHVGEKNESLSQQFFHCYNWTETSDRSTSVKGTVSLETRYSF
jgi:hypothetical protein